MCAALQDSPGGGMNPATTAKNAPKETTHTGHAQMHASQMPRRCTPRWGATSLMVVLIEVFPFDEAPYLAGLSGALLAWSTNLSTPRSWFGRAATDNVIGLLGGAESHRHAAPAARRGRPVGRGRRRCRR